MTIPAWMAPKEMLQGDLVIAVEADDRLRLGDTAYRYDRLGLRREA